MATSAARIDDNDWTTVGQPLPDAALKHQVYDAIVAAGELLGWEEPPEAREVADFKSADAALDLALAELLEHVDAADGGVRLGAVMRDVTEATKAVAVANVRARTEALSRTQRALGRLRSVGSVEQMMRMIPEEVTSIGFDRVILSRVQDSLWTPEHVYIDGDPEWAKQILDAGRERPQKLDEMLLETDMVRRRAPILIQDVQNHPHVHKPIADSSLSRSYVAAPLMPEGRVIGFLHADCYVTKRHVDEFDRDLLWMFAEGVGYAFERTVLLERLEGLRRRVHSLSSQMASAVDEFVDAEVEMQRVDATDAGSAARSASAALRVSPDSRIHSLLTRREIEIVRLMARGDTNADIARRLVISEGTVKTHVKHVLRKLRVANRAEAVSRFVRMTERERYGAGSADD